MGNCQGPSSEDSGKELRVSNGSEKDNNFFHAESYQYYYYVF